MPRSDRSSSINVNQPSSSTTAAFFAMPRTAMTPAPKRKRKRTAPNIHTNAIANELVGGGIAPSCLSEVLGVADEGPLSISRNVTLVAVFGKADHSNCGTSAAAMGRRTAPAREAIHTAWRSDADDRRNAIESPTATKRMTLVFAKTSRTKLICGLLYGPCRSIPATGL